MSSFPHPKAAGPRLDTLPPRPGAPPPLPPPAAAPPPPPPAAAPPRRRYDAQILASLDVALPPFKPPAGYGLAMGLLTAWLALIPLSYLALLAFLGWLVFWHALQALATLSEGPYFLFHLPMALLGAVLLLFLVKPVFFRRKAGEPAVVALREADEPLLFAFVRKLCDASGAPAPTLIEVDCEPNAAARFRGGFASLFGGELVLRIGLPLAAALPVRQFAGVVAHEFGHFNQRSGMTGSYLIRRLTFFFARIVFRRDRLDEKLARLRHHRSGPARGLYWLAVGLIEPTRGVLWMMLMGGELLTCGVLRRMEYDADRAEACVAGARDFARTSRLLMFLHLASKRARHDLSQTWEQQRLADDLPALIVANAKQLAEHRADIFKLIEDQKTGWLDTHPCHNDRVAYVESLGGEAATGLVECAVGAKHLFSDFGAVCRAATGAFYRNELEDKAARARLVPTKELVEQRSGERQSLKALRRFFRGRVSALRPVLPGPDAFLPADDPVEAIRALKANREAMLAVAESAGAIVEQLEESVPALAVARAQLTLSNIYYHVPRAAELRYKANQTVRTHEPRYADALRRLPVFEQAACRRLTNALRLLQCDAVAARLPDGRAARRSAAQLVAACQAMQRCVPAVVRLRELAVDLRVLFPSYSPEQPYQPLVRRIIETTQAAAGMLTALRDDLTMATYPFEHGTEGVSIGAALVQRLPDPHDPPDTCACVTGVVERFYTLLFRALAKLTDWAEKVETLARLEALPDPAEKLEKDEAEAKAEAEKESRATRRHWLAYGGRAAAGVALLSVLIWLSVSPPTFSVPWDHESGAAYRPNAFHVPFRQPAPYAPYTPPSAWPAGSPYGPGGPVGPRPPGMPYTPGGTYAPGVPYMPGVPHTPRGPQGPQGPAWAPHGPYTPASPRPSPAPSPSYHPYAPPAPSHPSGSPGWGGGGGGYHGGGGGGFSGGGGRR